MKEREFGTQGAGSAELLFHDRGYQALVLGSPQAPYVPLCEVCQVFKEGPSGPSSGSALTPIRWDAPR